MVCQERKYAIWWIKEAILGIRRTVIPNEKIAPGSFPGGCLIQSRRRKDTVFPPPELKRSGGFNYGQEQKSSFIQKGRGLVLP